MVGAARICTWRDVADLAIADRPREPNGLMARALQSLRDMATRVIKSSPMAKACLAVFAASVMATGCATKRDTGAAMGGVVGALAGGAVGDTPGMLIGGVLGALLGREVGAEFDRRDREQAAYILEHHGTQQTGQWVNPDTGYEYEMTPVETYYRAPDEPCREFQMLVDMRGQPERVFGTACRQPDGSWQIVGT
jgi:surface antigen